MPSKIKLLKCPSRILTWTLVSCALLSFVQCSSIGSLTATTENGATTAEELSDIESGLYDEGLINLPVTIAKLETPDLTKITITVTDAATPDSSPLFTTDGSKTFTITGTTDTVRNISVTPKITIINVTSGSQVTEDINADGSFTMQIAGELIDTLVLASMTEAETQVSPPLIIKSDDNGVIGISTTITTILNSHQDLMSDNQGNYYFTLMVDDGTFALMLRNLDGTDVEIIAEGLTSEPRILFSRDANTLIAITADGSVLTFTRSEQSALIKNSKTVSYAVTASWSSQILDTITDGIADIEDVASSGLSTWGHSVLTSSDNHALVLTYPLTHPGTGITNPYLIKIMYDDGTTESALPTTEFDNFQADIGATDNVIAAYSTASSDTSSFVSFPLPTAINGLTFSQAWEQRVPLFSEIPIDVYSIKASDDNTFVTSARDSNSDGKAELTIANYGDTTPSYINDTDSDINNYSNPHISKNGEFVIFCNLGYFDTDDATHVGFGQLMVYLPSVGSVGNFENLVVGDNFTTCTGNSNSYFIDEANFIHFYMYYDGNTAAQHGVIDPSQHPLLQNL